MSLTRDVGGAEIEQRVVYVGYVDNSSFKNVSEALNNLNETLDLSSAFSNLKEATKTLESSFADINRLEFLKSANKSIIDFANSVGVADVSLLDSEGNLRNYGEFTKGMLQLKEKDIDGYNRLAKNIHKQEMAIEDNTNAYHRFRGELMSTMFFGMQLQSTFGGLTSSAFDMAKTTSIASAMLGLMFLPEVLKVNSALFTFWGFMDKHPVLTEVMKGIVLVAATLGALFFYIGVVGLGISGLKDLDLAGHLRGWLPSLETSKTAIGKLWTILLDPVGSVKSFISSITLMMQTLSIFGYTGLAAVAIYLVIFILIATALKILYENWDYYFGLIKDIVGGVVDIILGFGKIIWGIIEIVGGVLIGFITGDWSTFYNGMKDVGDGIGQIWLGIKNIIRGVVGFISTMIIDFVLQTINAINWLIGKVSGVITWLGGKAITARIDTSGINDFKKNIQDYFGTSSINAPTISNNLVPKSNMITGSQIENLKNQTNITTVNINNPNISSQFDVDNITRQVRDTVNNTMTSIGEFQ